MDCWVKSSPFPKRTTRGCDYHSAFRPIRILRTVNSWHPHIDQHLLPGPSPSSQRRPKGQSTRTLLHPLECGRKPWNLVCAFARQWSAQSTEFFFRKPWRTTFSSPSSPTFPPFPPCPFDSRQRSLFASRPRTLVLLRFLGVRRPALDYPPSGLPCFGRWLAGRLFGLHRHAFVFLSHPRHTSSIGIPVCLSHTRKTRSTPSPSELLPDLARRSFLRSFFRPSLSQTKAMKRLDAFHSSALQSVKQMSVRP